MLSQGQGFSKVAVRGAQHFAEIKHPAWKFDMTRY